MEEYLVYGALGLGKAKKFNLGKAQLQLKAKIQDDEWSAVIDTKQAAERGLVGNPIRGLEDV